ncbi:MAG: heavy metal-responsive transcriptional regulator [Gammaproteobacteria bacterium]
MTTYRIGELSSKLGLSADTLRYYEKIGLLPGIARSASGLRSYCQEDISRIKFIKRAQRMGFSLTEISQLLEFRRSPQRAIPEVRELAGKKLVDIKAHLKDIKILHDELQLLINLCEGSTDRCPILEDFDNNNLDYL